MGETSAIEWTNHTFNPWIGCQKVGPGCDHCYAEAMMADRYGRVEWGPHGSRLRTSPANWKQPLKWDRAAAKAGRRDRVFCASLADVFDNHPSVLPEWRGDLWRLIDQTPNLDWLLLTKRPGNIPDMLPDGYGAPAWGDGWPNVWLGCTVVNQAEADRDTPKLLAVPAKVRFLSMEPLLEPVDLSAHLHDSDCYEVMTEEPTVGCFCADRDVREVTPNWIIVSGESGPNARPMHPDWARSLRDQCQAAGVPFFFKQWGEWAEADESTDIRAAALTNRLQYLDGTGPAMIRVGKSRAGRLLDGREWNEMPGVLTNG